MKRYMLLGDKSIVDTNKYTQQQLLFTKSIKESDNLLDLLEVGDCIEDVNEDIRNIGHYGDIEWAKENNIQAIWKRHNDIMRRYEV